MHLFRRHPNAYQGIRVHIWSVHKWASAAMTQNKVAGDFPFYHWCCGLHYNVVVALMLDATGSMLTYRMVSHALNNIVYALHVRMLSVSVYLLQPDIVFSYLVFGLQIPL